MDCLRASWPRSVPRGRAWIVLGRLHREGRSRVAHERQRRNQRGKVAMVNARKFEDAPAKREQTPVLVGLVSPSGAGKTFSALRMATGMQRMTGGEIFVLATEQKGPRPYAEEF